MIAGNGITLTYVGNTEEKYDIELTVQDHPHIRGEHPEKSTSFSHTIGSPSHTWGTLIVSTASSIIARDHPHIRGEHQWHSLLWLF